MSRQEAGNLLTKYGEKGFAYALAIYLLIRDFTLMSGLRETLASIKDVMIYYGGSR